MEICLNALDPGMRAVVTRMYCGDALRQRLADFGLIPGTEVACRYRSPGGDVSALELRGTVLAIRERDLRNIHGRRL